MGIDDSGYATQKLTVSVQEAAAMLGIGRATAYEGVRTGDIPSIRIGRRLVVPLSGLERLLKGQEVKNEDRG